MPRFRKHPGSEGISRRVLALIALPLSFLAAGCSIGRVAATPSNSTFSISPGTAVLDTNCTGCNSTTHQGSAVHQFAATLAAGGPASVSWSVYGGDPTSGPGKISPSGEYTPPSYITSDSVQVLVTATLNSNPAIAATSVLTITPGFLQPLTPENAALGANGVLVFTAYLAEAGGSKGITFSLADAPNAATGGLGSLSPANCQRDRQNFTSCTVIYTAPAVVPANATTYVVATVNASGSRAFAAVLLNAAEVSSNPATHQIQMPTTLQMGSTGGNNVDYDTAGNQIVDCCSGTLGALVEDATHRQYLLSNNHVLARSDQASVGEAIVQPGLIDNNCTPNGLGAGISTVATLSGWLPLSAPATNADAALAQVTSRTVDPSGSILELGSRQPDGTLAAAPPGISSSNGKGETASLDLKVAKSGRTTGLTCGSVLALDLDVTVDYFHDCAETKPYLTKTFTNQLGLSGNAFSDAGDSGALVVDAANAEPVGLLFAGGNDANGVTQGVASPAPNLLSELAAQLYGGSNSYSFVGVTDHPVSCLSYGDNTLLAAQNRSLPTDQMNLARQAATEARPMVNPAAGILTVATGKSSDHPGEAALLIYTDQAMNPVVPATVNGVRTVLVPTTARAIASGIAPLSVSLANSGVAPLPASAVSSAIAVKRQVAHDLLKRNPAFFAIGVGQSLDNPKEAALVIYVDRKHLPAQLPITVGGLRTRYVVMDRLHVTRSYTLANPPRLHCLPHPAPGSTDLFKPRPLPLN
jgi:hypothetical protein